MIEVGAVFKNNGRYIKIGIQKFQNIFIEKSIHRADKHQHKRKQQRPESNPLVVIMAPDGNDPCICQHEQQGTDHQYQQIAVTADMKCLCKQRTEP